MEPSAGMQQASGFVEPGAAGQRIVLNVGCGYPRRQKLHASFQGPEWRELRLDIDPTVKPDILCSITDMRPVADASVDAIWSSHNLEHLYRHEVPVALREFARVLRPGGQVLITLPDLQSVAELVAQDRLEDQAYMSPSGPISALDMIFGHTKSLARGDVFMAHKCGFTERTLRGVLEEARFAQVRVWRGESWDLWGAGQRSEVI